MKYYIAHFQVRADAEDLRQTARELLEAAAGEAGFESFEETSDGVDGYVQTDLFDRETLENELAHFPMEGVSVSYSVEEAEDRDWNEEWETAGFEPIVVGSRCCIHDSRHPLPADWPPTAIDVTIEARMAFGTGTHQTTRMVASRLLNMRLAGLRVLDCGCGTGILSIVAAKCGAGQVVAYDIDEWSVENTKHNARLNQVANIEAIQGDVNVLSHVCGVFDVVVANINRNILMADMPHFRDVMDSGAQLVVSGFYKADAPLLCQCAAELGLKTVATMSEDDWCCLVFQNA